MAVPTGVSLTNLVDYWPTFNATRTAEASKLFSMEWQISTVSDFATVLYTVTNTTQSAAAGAVSQQLSGTRTEVIPAGTYYLRARQLENGVTPHAWSGTVTVTSTVAPPSFSAPNIFPQGPTGSNTPRLAVDFLGDQSMPTYHRKLIPVIQFAAQPDFSGTTYTFDVGSVLKWAQAPTRVSFTGTAGTIPSGTYHVRMRARDEVGAYSAWVNGTDVSIVVSASASNLQPNNQVLPYTSTIQLTWTYNDQVGGSDQTAYRVIVYRSDNSAVVLDTGKVASNVKSATLAPATALKEIPLYWTVQVWNTQDYAGPVSSSATFTLTEPIPLTITSPDDIVATGKPTFNWDTGGTSPLRQWSFEVRQQADNSLVWSASGGSGDYPVTPDHNILSNDTTYVVNLSVTNASGEIVTATKTFSAEYSPPLSPSFYVDDSFYTEQGYVFINWVSATPDSGFQSWSVYRRLQGEQTWTRLYTTDQVDDTSYDDWSARAGTTYEYTVSQTAEVEGQEQESALVSLGFMATPKSGGYWLIDPDNSSNNQLVNVGSDTFGDELEESVLIVIGRGRVKQYGTNVGVAGDLTIKLRDGVDVTAQQKFAGLVTLRNLRKTLILRDPFGSLYNVALGAMSWNHIAGTGETEMFDVSIHFDEVY